MLADHAGGRHQHFLLGTAEQRRPQWRAVARAASSPRSPVAAFALPELTKTARAVRVGRPAAQRGATFVEMRARHRAPGAAQNTFCVNTAAQAHGSSDGHERKVAAGRVPCGTPRGRPPRGKPRAAGARRLPARAESAGGWQRAAAQRGARAGLMRHAVLGRGGVFLAALLGLFASGFLRSAGHRDGLEAASLGGRPQHDVRALHGLAGRALAQVVDGSHGHDAHVPRSTMPTPTCAWLVPATDAVAGRDARRKHLHEGSARA